jgi:hypothetical protein
VKNQVDLIYVANHRTVLQVLYYCPACGSVNEITAPHDLRALRCRDCRQINDASLAHIQVNESPDRAR